MEKIRKHNSFTVLITIFRHYNNYLNNELLTILATTIHHLTLIFVMLPLFIFVREPGVGDLFFGIAFIMETSTPFVAMRYRI